MPTTSEAPRPLLTVADVMELLSISRTTAYGLIARGELPVIRVGRAVRVHPQDLDRFLTARCSGTLDQAA